MRKIYNKFFSFVDWWSILFFVLIFEAGYLVCYIDQNLAKEWIELFLKYAIIFGAYTFFYMHYRKKLRNVKISIEKKEEKEEK